MHTFTLKGSLALTLVALSSGAHAALVGVSQSFPNITLNGNALIYDSNGVDANTGLLRIVSGGSTLFHAPRQPVGTQSYLGNGDDDNGDNFLNSMFTAAIDNRTGTLVTGSPFNRLTITEGNPLSSNSDNVFVFAWEGVITDFGFQVASTSRDAFRLSFDGRFQLTADRYERVRGRATALQSLYTDGLLTARAAEAGGFRIDVTTSGKGGGLPPGVTTLNNGVNLFLTDWVYTAARGDDDDDDDDAFKLPGQFIKGLAPGHRVLDGQVAANFWVPLPAAVWLLGSALGGLVVIGRRRAA